ncbi:MAG: hypothetical protein JJT78_03790 [Leptospira sp.]|nr:hypothetical protein [Leptospira sp.]
MNLLVSKKSFIIVLLIVFSFFSCAIFAQKNPKDPSLPKEPQVDGLDQRGETDRTKGSQDSKESKNNSNEKEQKLRVTLCDGRQIVGSWLEKNKEITFHHIRDGIRYQKTIQTNTIDKVRIQTWKAEIHKKENDGTAFKMLPNSVLIQLKSGESFQKDSGLQGTEYSVLKIKNENGSATVYSMWIDLLYKDGNWYSKLKKITPEEDRTDCHKDVIREIQFL